ncbi:3-oxoadipate enol-lactonase [Glycomyces sp. NPDC048151]|uniref:3-oxoadipate enol-lactonase n=1 Tax=Glycomyces sp. NPDC048151 TaxID=3364002 RepID=UPI0037221969
MIPHHLVDGPADAETIVFSNSLGTTLGMWRPQVEAFSAHYRVVRYDTRGHGRTRFGGSPFGIDDLADDVADLLDHLDTERAHLVGVSLGGATVLDFAARHPDRTLTVTALCTAARIATPAYWADRVRLVRTGGLPPLAPAAMERWFTADFRAAHPEVVKRFRADFAGGDPLGYTACCRAIAETDLQGRLGAIRAPVLVMYGTEDTITTADDAEALRQGIRGCETAAIEGAKHLAPTEQADFVNRRIAEHLRKAPHGPQ